MSKLFVNPPTITWGSEHVVGDVFEVQVCITDVIDCYAVQFGVEWDSTVLEFVEEPSKGDFLEATGVTTYWVTHSEANSVLCGYLRFQAPSGVDVPATESGLVATLKFKTLKTNATTNITFAEADCIWFDSAFNTYTFTELASANFTFGVVAPPEYPKLTIINVTAPSTASANETFEVLTDWRNDGETGTAWTRLLDLDTNIELSPRTEFYVDKAQTGTIKQIVTMPSDRDLPLRVEIGHLE